ncbi:MAG: serine hydrolase, partial [Leptospiraceae bacterium]|nr:serine hydrolase [Leptospiraceae bacterium]
CLTYSQKDYIPVQVQAIFDEKVYESIPCKPKNLSLICLLQAKRELLDEVLRLYNILTLFSPDKIVYNFSNMDKIGMPIIYLRRSGKVHKFQKNISPIPETFLYKNKTYNSKKFLEESITTALIIVQDNTIIYEDYYLGTKDTDLRISWSVTKSFISALFGPPVATGQIKITDKITKYVPELKESGYKDASVKNVLQMSSGVYFDENYTKLSSDINRLGRILALGGSFDKFALSLRSQRKPGTFLHYVSIDTHVLGMVLRNVTGEKIQNLFVKNLWSHLGAEANAYFLADDTGEAMALGGLCLRSRDMARFGILYLQDGFLNGRQVIPKAWIQESTYPQEKYLFPGKRDTASTVHGYGYQWWIPEDFDKEFLAVGIYDQMIYINKKSNVVIVKNSANYNFANNNFQSSNQAIAFFRAVAEKYSLDKRKPSPVRGSNP